jgi:serine/threonine protein kinase
MTHIREPSGSYTQGGYSKQQRPDLLCSPESVGYSRTVVVTTRYRVLFELGEGGTATVHLALARGPGGFNKLVVVKALRRALSEDADMRRLFLQEANISARFNHPNIVQVLEVFEQENLPMIVLEYLDGQTLEHVTKSDRGLPLGLHLHAIGRVVRALEYAHDFIDFDGQRVEVVHRDVSPHNVMLTYEGHVKLLDFGIAKLASEVGRTETGIIRGKLRYMAPEQVLGESIDRRADLFAVGVLLWQAVAGEKLWKDLSEPQILDRIANGRIPPPVLRPGAPAGLERVILKALAPAAEDRYQTAAELSADLVPLIAEIQTGDGDGGLGRFLSASFRETREKTRIVIDTKMRESPVSPDVGMPVDFGTGSVPALPSAGGSASRTVAAGAPMQRALAITVLTVAVFTLGLVARALWSDPAPVPAPPPMAIGPSVALVDAAVEQAVDASGGADASTEHLVTLQITAFPGTATLTLDGEALTGNPFTRTLPADDATHVVRAEAPGHDAHEEAIVLDRDRSVVLRLTPRASARRRIDAGTGAASAPSECNPPYSYDERGVKIYRPQCFR